MKSKLDVHGRFKSLSKHLAAATKWLYHYSGAKFICRKFRPVEDHRPLPTGPIWIIGTYVALFGIASGRYESRIDIIENRANSIYAQLGTTAKKQALSRMSMVQNMKAPVKPNIINPLTVGSSFFQNDYYDEMLKQLKNTVEDWKEDLSRVNLVEANLIEADLIEANLSKAILNRALLRGANLSRTNLSRAFLFKANLSRTNLSRADLGKAYLRETNLFDANLFGANLFKANLFKADLREADLGKTNLIGADLRGANLGKTNLIGADLRGAKGLNVVQLCSVKSLLRATLNPDFKKSIEQKCPKIINKSN